MGKYSAIQSDVFSVFDKQTWKDEALETVPSNFTATGGTEFIRVSIVASGKGVNRSSASGVIVIDIYTAAGQGPTRAQQVADRLDSFLANKSIESVSGKRTQFSESALGATVPDQTNKSLVRTSYEIPFNYFGVT